MGKKGICAAKALKRVGSLLLAAVLLAFIAAPMAAAAPQAQATKCSTRYPIVFVHGAGFTDKTFGINYWGRIPSELADHGAKIYYGDTDGWGSIESNAAQLKETIEKVLAQTGSRKVNLIAHSKGGLEARYMISSLGMVSKVASLTMICTPNHGSETMSSLMEYPDILFRGAALFVDGFRRLSGDESPDFYNGIQGLTAEYMKNFNKKNKDKSGVYYQSYAAALAAPASDLILCWPAYLIKSIEGQNDGLVTVESAKWTNFRGVLRGAGYRGVSHADVADLRRTDLEIDPSLNGATTIRGFYVNMVTELKSKGY